MEALETEIHQLRTNNQMLEDQLYQVNRQFDYYKDQKNAEVVDLINKTSGYQLEKLRNEDMQLESMKKNEYMAREMEILQNKLEIMDRLQTGQDQI